MNEINKIEYISDSNFKERLFSSKSPSVILFIKEYSGNSHLIEKTLKDVVNNFTNSINFFVVDADKNSLLKKEFHVNDFPTMIFFKNGLLLDQNTGLISKNELLSKIFELLKIDPSLIMKLAKK